MGVGERKPEGEAENTEAAYDRHYSRQAAQSREASAVRKPVVAQEISFLDP